MKPLLIGFLITILVLLLLALPFKIKVKFFADGVNMVSFYSVKVAFIKLLCGKTYIEDGKFIMQNTHNIFVTDTKMSRREKAIIKNIIMLLAVTRVELYFSAGEDGDAYKTAMICGYAYSLSSAITAFLISNNQFINIYQDIDPNFKNGELNISISGIVELSILDIIVALIKSRKYKENKNGKI